MNRSEVGEVSVARRVAFYIYSLDQGGAERVTSILANKFSEFKIDVTVIVMKPVSLRSYTLADDVKVISMFEEPIEKTGSGLVFNIKRIILLRKLIKHLSPQVLYTMMVDANVVGSIALLGSAVPCVISERNDPSQFRVGRPWNAVRKIAYGLSYSAVAQTVRAQRWLNRNTRAKRVVVIPNPVEFPLLDSRPHVAVPENSGPMILAVGRLCSQKQFDHLVDAISQLTDEFPNWWVSILGEGVDRDTLREKIVNCGLDKKIKLVGRVGNIGDWYQSASMFVMTSRYEGYPNSLIEAMASGVPVVSYDCPSGPAEVIRHGANGRLAAANNVRDLVLNMRIIMADATNAKNISAGKALDIRAMLNPDVIANKWLSAAGLKRPKKASDKALRD